MALVPTNWRKVDSGKFPEVNSMTEGLERVRIETGYVVDPNNGKELVIEQITTVINQVGNEIRREHEWWTIESINALPSAHRKTIEARLWIPGQNYRNRLELVQDERTAYKLGTAYSNGPLAYKKLVEGLCVYTVAQVAPDLTSAAATTKARAQGRTTANAADLKNKRAIPDSARSWETAVREQRIIETPTAPQYTRWQTLHQEVQAVDEDWRAWIVTTATKNCLVPGDLQVRVAIVQKPNIRYAFPYKIPAPRLSAFARYESSKLGARIEVRGGDVVLPLPYPFDDEEERVPVRCYRIYRRIVSYVETDQSRDRFHVWETPPGEQAHSILDVQVRDENGDPIPWPQPGAQTQPQEPDRNAADDDARWEMIVEIPNEETDPGKQSHAHTFDPAVAEARVVEYYAIAVIGDTESPESNHEQVTVAADSTSSSLEVTLHQKQKFKVVDIRRPGVPMGGYGDTAIVPWPVLVTE